MKGPSQFATPMGSLRHALIINWYFGLFGLFWGSRRA